MNKPFSEACERNREPILHYLQQWLVKPELVVEVGSGTGQHAVYFAEHMPHLLWQPTDRAEHLAGITMWREESKLNNLLMPVELDVEKSWTITTCASIYSANTLHIMSFDAVKKFFNHVAQQLHENGQLIVYGPFNYNGQYTSESNQLFDQWLKSRDVKSGIRDFEEIDQLAVKAGLVLKDDCSMPANNRLLRWCRLQSC